MSGHTPGPWEFFKGPEGRQHLTFYRGGKDLPPVTFLRLDDASEADARLIAAAPELLEAAKRVHEAFNDHPWHDDKGNRLDELEAVIAKAEGKA